MVTTNYYDEGTLAGAEEVDEFKNIATVIHLLGFIISIPFLLVTFIIYTILPELRNIHGLTLRGYVGSILGICTVFLTFLITTIQDVRPPCLVIGYALCFPLIASYFWVNVMSFDIWWTFGGVGPLKIGKSKRERKKFIFYSIYVWGWATLLTTIWAIVDYSSQQIPDEDHDCLLSVSSWYVYGPIGVTLFCNMVLYILTIRKMIRHNKETAKHLDTKDSRRQDKNKQCFALYMKLFLMMGTTFSLEVISWMSQDSKYIEFVKNLSLSYDGIITFIMFICKKKIWRLILKRFRCQRTNFLKSSSRRNTHLSSFPDTRNTSVPVHGTVESPARRF